MRVTWIQPEDLVGHELRQAREEGKNVDAIEARWLAAGGRPAPGRGASQEVSPPELVAFAGELLDELVAAGASLQPNGLLLDSSAAPATAARLARAGLGPVTASRPDFIFQVESPAFNALKARVFDSCGKI